MSTFQTRAQIMTEYATGITGRLAAADALLRQAVAAGDTDALLAGMAEREAALAATEELVGELDLAGLAAAEHAAIIRQMVQALERSQVAQAALEAEMFTARRRVIRELAAPGDEPRTGPLPQRSGYALPPYRRGLRSTG